MGLFRELTREYVRHRLYGRRRPRHRQTYYRGWGAPRGRQSGRMVQRGYGGHRGHRRHSRSNVRVVGCCLPIPMAMALGAAGLRTALVARRR